MTKTITPAEALSTLYPGALLTVRYRGTGQRVAYVTRLGRRGQVYISTHDPKRRTNAKERLLRADEIVSAFGAPHRVDVA
ncbi:hypothetical protein [Microvirga yunnanensis]|uniref:hypothetical protein n=1 Tax=Microvirga yunnanensis TaxID=2953740 RepID=UPI0021C6AFC8|nr:hypothetical protein [Microvirga sp. HBU67655]